MFCSLVDSLLAQDTDLAEAHFVKHRQGRGAHREALATKAAAGR
jgi:hypothetical protein